MNIDKVFFYDWVGANEWIFRQINALDGNPTYDSLMVFLSRIAEHQNFPYIMILFGFFAGAEYLLRKISGKGGAEHALVAWIGVLCVMTVSYGIDGLAVKTLKNYFEFPRPYIALGSSDVTVLDGSHNASDDYHSFPSGHASFITVVVLSLWPLLSGRAPIIGLLLIFAVCWSRIAMGMHFPVDVVAGVFISSVIVLIVRAIIYKLLLKLFKWKC